MHGLEIAERDEPLQAERVEAVSGQQGEVAVFVADDPRVAVVQQVALVDRLDEQLVVLTPALRARAFRRETETETTS